MATVASYNITINLTYPASNNANPINAQTVQAVAPWGKSPQRNTLREALEDLLYRSGSELAGRQGLYYLNQTTNATEVGIP